MQNSVGEMVGEVKRDFSLYKTIDTRIPDYYLDGSSVFSGNGFASGQFLWLTSGLTEPQTIRRIIWESNQVARKSQS